MSADKKKELVEILRMFIYYDRKRSDRWIKDRSLYAALADLLNKGREDAINLAYRAVLGGSQDEELAEAVKEFLQLNLASADSILITREQLEGFYKSVRELQLRFGVRSGECRTCDAVTKGSAIFHSGDCPIPELNRTVENLARALAEKRG